MRLLIKTVGLFIYTTNQGVIDLDSAMILASHAEHVNHSLSYNEDFYDGIQLPGQELVDKDNIPAGVSLLQKLHGVDRVLLLLQLGGWYLHRTGAAPSDLNQAYAYLQQAEKETEALHNYKLHAATLNLLGTYATQAENVALRKRCFLLLVDVCKKQNSTIMLANAWNHEADCLPYEDTTKPVLLKKALSIYQQLNEKEDEIEVLGKVAGVFFAYGEMDSVRKFTYRALELQKAIGFRHTHFSYNVLAFIDMMKPDLPNALRNANTGVNTMEANGDTLLAPYFYIMLAQVYRGIQRNEEVIAIFEKVINSYREGPFFWYNLFFTTVNTLLDENRNDEALEMLQRVTKKYPPQTELSKMYVAQISALTYQNLQQPKEAEKYWLEMIRIADKIQTPEMYKDIVNAYSSLAYFYTISQQYDKAKLYLDKATKFSTTIISPSAKRSIAASHYKIDSAMKNYFLALKEYQTYRYFDDSFWSSDRAKEYQELFIKYETEKKEKNIQLLNNKTKLQQTELTNAAILKNVTLAGIAVLLMIIALIYNQYRIKRNTNDKISEKNQALGQLLNEKEWLLKEIHHRVKNNLQMIISLLESQSTYLKDDALLAMKSSQNRVHAMSIIHQKLYQTENVTSIDMAQYMPELIDYLRDSFNTGKQIQFQSEIDPLELDVTQAMPVGLILNEAITNSLKYAFPNTNNGIINIILKRSPNDRILLRVSDNGVGLPADFDIANISSLGMRLMKGLTEEINGAFTIKNQGGTTINIKFKNSVIR